MAYCKPIYTLFRNGALLVNGGTAEEVAEKALADYEKFCPAPTPPTPDCNVEFLDIAFDGNNFTITLTPESTAPYLFFSSISAQEGTTEFDPTPAFPLTISFADLFPNASTEDIQNIIILASEFEKPKGEQDICDIDIVYFVYEAEDEHSAEVDFLLPTAIEGCEGAITFTLLYTNAASAVIDDGELTVSDAAGSISYIAAYCNGLIHAVYIYEIPAPVNPD